MRSGLASGTTPTTLRVSFQVFDNIVKIFHNFSLNIFLEPLIRNEKLIQTNVGNTNGGDMFEKNTDEKSLSTESNWDIIIHQEQWHPTGGGITAKVNTTTINVSPVITSRYYSGDDTDYIEDTTTDDKMKTVDQGKVRKI